MIGWTWKKESVSPEDILDAANTLPTSSSWHEVELIPNWLSSEYYLSWAKDCLIRNDEFNRDAAVCYAKRAACRQIDALMVYNHLSKFLKKDYPKKAAMLRQVGLSIPEVIQLLIIDPRNEIEHGYTSISPEQAKHAVQLAEMFLRSLAPEIERKAVISLASPIGFCGRMSSVPEREQDHIEFDLNRKHSSSLFIDVSSVDHRALIISPKEETLMICPLVQFEKDRAIKLATMLRKNALSANSSGQKLEFKYLEKLRSDLCLE